MLILPARPLDIENLYLHLLLFLLCIRPQIVGVLLLFVVVVFVLFKKDGLHNSISFNYMTKKGKEKELLSYHFIIL